MTLMTKTRPVIAHPLQAARLALEAIRAMARSFAARQKVRQLSDMPDYILTDMGLKRDDISHALAAGWREDATYRLALIAARRRRGLCD